MVPRGHWTRKNIDSLWKQLRQSKEEANAAIRKVEYKVADIEEIAEFQSHLSLGEKNKFKAMLQEYVPLLQGTQGCFKGEPITLELPPGSKPYFSKPYSIPKAYMKVTKGEINQLETIGLLTRVQSAEWAAPTFVIPKKNGTVRIITDFCMLNACLKLKPFPMPKIPEIFRGMENFKYATTLDLNMGYYSMPLDDDSKALCVTVLPWGLYQYNALPMGIKPATDIFQERMSSLFYDLRQIVVYMDDLKALGFLDFDDHLNLLHEVLRRLLNAGFK
jgi:hypothetical protein